MTRLPMLTLGPAVLVLSAATCGTALAADAGTGARGLDKIQTVVVIYAENRSFDTLFGSFPGANGIGQASQESLRQRDRDGSPLTELPPVWGGLTAPGVVPPVTQAMTEHLPNAPFTVDDPQGFNVSLGTVTHDLWHRFYQNQMQIDGGRNDMFVAWADSGAMPMGHWDGSRTAMWEVAKRYALADNFFMGAFGGSFFNHMWLACACAPSYPDADKSPAKPSISAVEPDGVTLRVAENSPRSAMDGVPKFVADGNLTPDFYAVNTMQPPYQPSANAPAPDGDPALADPSNPTTLPPQAEPTIGDLLSLRRVSWAWYAGAWQYVLDHGNHLPVPNFQYHHQPYNYFLNFAPGTAARREHIRDAGLNGASLIEAIDEGRLPQVTFYKPQGNLNEHSGYADIQAGDRHIADVVSHLERSPQWPRMLVVVTYDENGGIWDHVAPPRGDRWGPGTRIPTIVVSPFAKRGFVDHTPYDTTSVLRLITERFALPTLRGITARAEAIRARGGPPLGDLTNALDLDHD